METKFLFHIYRKTNLNTLHLIFTRNCNTSHYRGVINSILGDKCLAIYRHIFNNVYLAFDCKCFETSLALVHSGVELTVGKVRVELMCNPTHLLMPTM